MSHFKDESPFILLYTKNIQKTFEFYRDLTAQIIEHKDDKVVIDIGEFNLHFILESTEPVEEYFSIMSKTNRKSGQGIIFYIEARDINKTFELVTTIGGKIIKEIYENHWGYKEFLFADPNGYKFAVWG